MINQKASIVILISAVALLALVGPALQLKGDTLLQIPDCIDCGPSENCCTDDPCPSCKTDCESYMASISAIYIPVISGDWESISADQQLCYTDYYCEATTTPCGTAGEFTCRMDTSVAFENMVPGCGVGSPCQDPDPDPGVG